MLLIMKAVVDILFSLKIWTNALMFKLKKWNRRKCIQWRNLVVSTIIFSNEANLYFKKELPLEENECKNIVLNKNLVEGYL